MIYRIDVRTTPARPRRRAGRRSRRRSHPPSDSANSAPHVGPIEHAADFPDRRRCRLVARSSAAASELLADPIVESAEVIDRRQPNDAGSSRIEIHLKPGVMDPVAASTEMALRDMGLDGRRSAHRPGVSDRRRRSRASELQRIASRVLANGVIESVHFDAFVPAAIRDRPRVQFQASPRAAARAERRATDEAQPRGASVSVAGGDEGDSDLLPRAGPRADRYRAGNARPDLERALRSQDAQERGGCGSAGRGRQSRSAPATTRT